LSEQAGYGNFKGFASQKAATLISDVNAREGIKVTEGGIDWIYPGGNELTSYTID